MSPSEPSKVEIALTVLAGALGSSMYRDYVDSLDLAGNEQILDYGSGSGTPARYLARRLLKNGGQVTCVDVSRVWMEVARQRLSRYTNVIFLHGELESLDLSDSSFDVVFVHFVLHDIPSERRMSVMSELARVLKSAGRLYLREPLRFISTVEVEQLIAANRLVLERASRGEIPTQGVIFSGVYQKPAG